MENANELLFDRVHDTARIYRALVNILSYPGRLENIGETAGKLGHSTQQERLVMALAETLLDTEASFCLPQAAYAHLAEDIASRTYGRWAPPEQADYLFIDGTMGGDEYVPLLSQCKKGSLVYPEESATLFLLVGTMRMDKSSEADWIWTGPGIEERIGCSLTGISSGWLLQRSRMSEDYPLGVDIVLMTASGTLLGLPRSLSVAKGRSA